MRSATIRSLFIRLLISRFRRILTGVLGSVLLVALPLGMPMPASASPLVQVLNTSTWTESYNGALHVVGEVKNAGSTSIEFIQLQANYYDTSNILLKTQPVYASMSILNPGEKSPFVLVDVKPATFDHAVVSFITAYEPKPADYRGLNAIVTNETTDAYNDTTFTGTVTNNSSTVAQRPQMVATFYSPYGQVVNTAIGYSQKTALAPGESDTFSLFVGGTLFSSYSLQTQADNRLSAPVATTTTTTVPTSSTTTTAPMPTTTTTTAAPAPSQPTAAAKRSGYWMLGSDGAVYAFGDAKQVGNATNVTTPTWQDIESTPDGNGYWLVDAAGHVSCFGTALCVGRAAGSLGKNETVSSLSATPSGNGYWIFTNFGRALTYGDAAFHGDMSGVKLNGPVLDSVTTPSGNGYYMVASDGGIFAFGDAQFHGSMGGKQLNAPVQSLVPDGDGDGYWLVASDGGIFAFDAPFLGSMGSARLNKPVTGMVGFGSNGYLMVAEDGGIFAFGTADFRGSLGSNPPAHPITSVATLSR